MDGFEGGGEVLERFVSGCAYQYTVLNAYVNTGAHPPPPQY